MADTLTIFEIEGAWAEVIDTSSYIRTEEGEVVFYVTARVHYQNNQSRKDAGKLLRDNGWVKSPSSSDFLLKKVLRDELKIRV